MESLIDLKDVDEIIRPAVKTLQENGFQLIGAFGKGSPFGHPSVHFRGDEFDCIRAYELCDQLGLTVAWAVRKFNKAPIYDANLKQIGREWEKPSNIIMFVIHSETGTIFRPN